MLRPRTNQVVSIIDELMRQSNRDAAPANLSPFPFESLGVPFQASTSGSSTPVMNKALDMTNIARKPTPLMPASMRSQVEPFRPKVNLGQDSFIGQQTTRGFPAEVNMVDASQPSPMALEAMGEEAVATMDRPLDLKEREAGEKAMQAFQIEQSNKKLKTDPTFQERISGFFGNRENMLRMAMAFNTMRLEPDQGLASVIQSELKDLRSTRRSSETANKTVAALRAMNTKEANQAADMIEANPTLAKEIYAKYVGTELEKPGKQRKGESDLRKEFVGNAEIKDFGKQASAFGRVVASAQDPSAAGDLALIFNYMKVLDPGSTVREGEFATAQNAAGVPGRILSLYNNVIKGERLNPEQRNDFVNRSRMLFQQADRGFQGIRSQYQSIAKDYGYDLDRAVPDIYSSSSELANPQITYDQLPQETKDRFANEAAWNTHFQNLPYLEQLRLMRLL